MTFTAQVKKELTLLEPRVGTLIALIRTNGHLSLTYEGLNLSISTENAATSKYIYQLLTDLYEEITVETQVYQKTNLAKNRVYMVLVKSSLDQLLDDLALSDVLLLDQGIPELVRIDADMQADYLSGCFLANGTVSDPEKGDYQLTLSFVYQEHAEDIRDLLTRFRLHGKLATRKHKHLVYLSRAEEIMDFLTLIGAVQSRLQFEKVKIIREIRGLANRQANFEVANLSKVAKAARIQIEAIITLQKRGELVSLPAHLAELADLRIAYPEATLSDLGAMLHPPLGKSGVNHRLRKLADLAHKKIAYPNGSGQ